jgi:hypothetical protein
MLYQLLILMIFFQYKTQIFIYSRTCVCLIISPLRVNSSQYKILLTFSKITCVLCGFVKATYLFPNSGILICIYTMNLCSLLQRPPFLPTSCTFVPIPNIFVYIFVPFKHASLFNRLCYIPLVKKIDILKSLLISL